MDDPTSTRPLGEPLAPEHFDDLHPDHQSLVLGAIDAFIDDRLSSAEVARQLDRLEAGELEHDDWIAWLAKAVSDGRRAVDDAL